MSDPTSLLISPSPADILYDKVVNWACLISPSVFDLAKILVLYFCRFLVAILGKNRLKIGLK